MCKVTVLHQAILHCLDICLIDIMENPHPYLIRHHAQSCHWMGELNFCGSIGV